MKIRELVEAKQISVRDAFEEVEKEYKGNFSCSHKQLTSLKGAPQTVNGYFRCNNNQLTSLEGGPQTVNGSFDCDNNKLTSLEGGPKTVNGNFYCGNNQLTSLKDIHHQIHEINGYFWALNNPITSHVLGLLKIKGLKKVHLDNKEVQDIINKYLGQGNAGLIKAQRELIAADLDDYAEL